MDPRPPVQDQTYLAMCICDIEAAMEQMKGGPYDPGVVGATKTLASALHNAKRVLAMLEAARKPEPPKPSEEAVRRAQSYLVANIRVAADFTDEHFREAVQALAFSFDGVAEQERKACAKIAGTEQRRAFTDPEEELFSPPARAIGGIDLTTQLNRARRAILSRTGCPKGDA